MGSGLSRSAFAYAETSLNAPSAAARLAGIKLDYNNVTRTRTGPTLPKHSRPSAFAEAAGLTFHSSQAPVLDLYS